MPERLRIIIRELVPGVAAVDVIAVDKSQALHVRQLVAEALELRMTRLEQVVDVLKDRMAQENIDVDFVEAAK